MCRTGPTVAPPRCRGQAARVYAELRLGRQHLGLGQVCGLSWYRAVAQLTPSPVYCQCQWDAVVAEARGDTWHVGRDGARGEIGGHHDTALAPAAAPGHPPHPGPRWILVITSACTATLNCPELSKNPVSGVGQKVLKIHTMTLNKIHN